MTLLLSLFSLTMACSGEVNTDDTSSSDDTGVADTADTADTAESFDCDYSAIAGDWAGTTNQGLGQTLNLESEVNYEEIVGMNNLYMGGEDPVCIFEMDCRTPAEGTLYQVYNTVAPGSSDQCLPGWYTFEPAGDELQIAYHDTQFSEPLFTYKLQAN